MGDPKAFEFHSTVPKLSWNLPKRFTFRHFHFKLLGYLQILKGKFLKTPLMDTLLFSFHERFPLTRSPFTVVKKTGLSACLWVILLGGCVSHPFAHLEEWKEVRTSISFFIAMPKNMALEIANNLENFRAIAWK